MRHYPRLLTEKVNGNINIVDIWFYQSVGIVTMIKITYDSNNTENINIYGQQ